MQVIVRKVGQRLADVRSNVKTYGAAVALLTPVAAFAQTTNPWDTAFDAAETKFTALETSAYVLMGLISVGLLIYGLARKFIRRG